MKNNKLSCLLLRSNILQEIKELHINFWDFDSKTIIMDIGILLEYSNIKSQINLLKDDYIKISMHIPSKIKKNSILDLGEILSSDADMIAAIFNEPINLHTKTGKVTFFERKNNNKIILIDLDIEDGNNTKIEYDNNQDFSSITVNISNWFKHHEKYLSEIEAQDKDSNNNIYLYLRIRLKDIQKAKFIDNFNPKDYTVLSSYIQNKILDFRINESRWIPRKLQSNILRIKKVHCFLIIHREYELNHQSKNFKGSRSLVEEPIWRKYLLNEYKTFFNMGYHWTDNNESDDYKSFQILGRFSRILSSPLQVIGFLFFILITSMLANMSFMLLDKLFISKQLNIDIKTTMILTGILVILLLVIILSIRIRHLVTDIFIKLKNYSIRLWTSIKNWLSDNGDY